MKTVFCLLLIIASAVASAADPAIKGHFQNAEKRAKRTATTFKLAKVDLYNREARKAGRPEIAYQAYWLELPAAERALDFVFPNLSEEQFAIVKSLYGNVSHSSAKPGVHAYRLIDFMPPAIQALNGHTFKYAQSQVHEINEGRSDGYKTADAKVSSYITTSINCWGTVYGILKTNPFAEERAEPGAFTVFYTGRFQAHDFFSRLGQEVGTVAIAKGKAARIPEGTPVEFGDILLFITERQLLRDVVMTNRGEIIESTKGSLLKMMEHAAIHIDDGLIFEKSNGGSDDPFRFMPLAEAVKPYTSVSPVEIEIRRHHSSLPHASEVFGGTKYAVEANYKTPIPAYLRRIFLMHKEIMFPQEGEYYNEYSQAVDVGFRFNSVSGRYELAPEAYDSRTFDANLNAQKAAASFCERKLGS